MSDRYAEVARQLRADVAVAVRRAQRRHIMRLTARYTAVLLLTAGSVAAGVLARRYIQSLTAPWQLLLILLLWLTIVIGIVRLASLSRSAGGRSGLEQRQARQNIWLATFRVAMRPMPGWVAALAIAAVLVAISSLTYDNWSAVVERRTSPDPLFRVLIGMAALLTAALARSAFRRWWPGGPPGTSTEEALGSAEDVRAEPRTRPVEVATERVRDGTQTFVVRLKAHRDPGTQILQEVAG